MTLQTEQTFHELSDKTREELVEMIVELRAKVRERQYPWEREDKAKLVGFNQDGAVYWREGDGIFEARRRT